MRLDKLFAKPLTLRVGGQDISFNTLKEFEFALAGRTEVPTSKMAELVNLSTKDLKREAKSIKAVEKQFVEMLSKSIETQRGLAEFLRKLDPKVFSQDHDWREIMASLRDKDEDYDELRHVALVKYMQYLASRQEVIKHTYSVKKLQNRDTEEVAENGQQAAMRETVILEAEVIKPKAKDPGELARLPKGEPVVLDLGPGEQLQVMLSKHPFTLLHDGGCVLIDEGGERYPLEPGKNIVGRDTVCNVTVRQELRDVSRLHLVVECLSDNEVRLTDLSSHGTYLPAGALEHTEV